MFIVGTVVPTVYLAVKYPDALQRRMTSGPWAETRLAQKFVTVAIVLMVVAVGAVSALDHRFDWSRVPTAVVVLGNVLVLAGLALAEVVVIQDNYAAATITVEEEQTVVSTGLYGLVRHPMYVGALIMMIGMPLALESYWGLLAVVPGVGVFALRINDKKRCCTRNSTATTSTRRRCTIACYPGCGDDENPCPNAQSVCAHERRNQRCHADSGGRLT